ncbi:MAG: aspartate-semialdehyde dehydrogenase [Lachnospiraceae bacterium]|nr:aspartate-semialdehyde dehydrogenase [Lachnospiraceae bacterium]
MKYQPSKKFRVGVIGATGMVGQRFLCLLDNHPYFEVTVLAASGRSAGKAYAEVIEGRWKLDLPIPEYAKNMVIVDASHVEEVASLCDFVFCAVDMKKDEIRAMEEAYAKAETPVVSNNSANRGTPDVPMVVPEINPEHLAVIEQQRRRLGTKRGFIAVKPNCSIQSYVPLLTPLLDLKPTFVTATTYQAISGAGKTFREWPEMIDNVIPYIGGEEEKSEKEPLKVWGTLTENGIVPASSPVFDVQCIRVPVTNGHLAAVFVKFEKKPEREEILRRWKEYRGIPQELELPSAPKQFLTYFEEDNRPQTGVDRMLENGMGIAAGRLREDESGPYDYKFIGLSHNTLRGAAGGAVEIAELLCAQGWITAKD